MKKTFIILVTLISTYNVNFTDVAHEEPIDSCFSDNELTILREGLAFFEGELKKKYKLSNINDLYSLYLKEASNYDFSPGLSKLTHLDSIYIEKLKKNKMFEENYRIGFLFFFFLIFLLMPWN